MFNLKIYIKHWYDIDMHKNKVRISIILTGLCPQQSEQNINQSQF